MKKAIILFLTCMFTGQLCAQPIGNYKWDELAKLVENGIWVQPAKGEEAIPVWGFKNGIRIGISPPGGPRGLLRVYTPYMGQDEFGVINYIALEPIPEGHIHRGLSELEFSRYDNVQGKRFWSVDHPDQKTAKNPVLPAAGIIGYKDKNQTLTVYIVSEPFDNGAEVYVKLEFTEGRPHEVALSTYATDSSVPLSKFYLSATMGNYMRLRNFHLADGSYVNSKSIWPDYTDDNFTPHYHVPLEHLIRDKKGGAWLVAAPDEEDPSSADYPATTTSNWKYKGISGTQYWYIADPLPSLCGAVNGRYYYWGKSSPIPGGISFENFEADEPFRDGATYIFGVTPQHPRQFIKDIRKRQRAN